MKINYFKSIVGTGESKEYLFPTLRIAYVVSGEFDWQIGSDIYSLNEGDVILLNNLLARKITNKSQNPLHIDIFEFSPLEIQSRPAIINAFYCNRTTIIKKHKLVGKLLHTISENFDSISNQSFHEHIMYAVFELMEGIFGNTEISANYPELAFQASKYIWNNFGEDISVMTVAKHLCVSKNHLEKIFKQVHGTSVGMYIRSIRIYNVVKILNSSPERTVLDVALSCGFKSSSGFYKTYKTLTGNNPKRL